MAQLPAITIIEASDAPRHTSRLQEILRILQSENRIRSFITIRVGNDLSSINEAAKEKDMIMIVLTHQLHAQKEQIDNKIRAFKAEESGIRVDEIIVDNVPYENEFITFPADLRPIRERNDMDAVWSSIHQSLKEMFPQKESRESDTEPSGNRWKKYLKIGKAAIVYIVLVFAVFTVLFMLIAKLLGDTGQDLIMPLLIITFLMAMVISFFLTRKMVWRKQSPKPD